MSDDVDIVPPQPAAEPAEENLADEAPVGAATSGHVDLAALGETVVIDPSLFERRLAAPVFDRHVLTTSLHLKVAGESRTNLWKEWNGYTSADVLTDLEAEYAALRHAAALSDVSPLVKYRISGRDAGHYLARLVAGNARDLSIGDVAPVVFCEDRGFVVGDGLLFRLGDEEYRLVTEETHLAWLLDSAVGFSVRIEDVSATLAVLSLQGPLAAQILRDAGFDGIEALRPYVARWFDIIGMPVYVSRTGVSGDLGYELWIDPDDAPLVWTRLLDKGAGLGLRAGGLALRELARIEAGVARAGCDYFGAFSAPDPAASSTPFELGLASLVDLEGGHFTGRDALRRAREAAPRHLLAGVMVDFAAPLTFSGIFMGSAIKGVATSTGFSFSLGVNVGLAVLKPGAVAGDVALSVEVEIREGFALHRLNLPLRVVPGPVLAMPARHMLPAPLGPIPDRNPDGFVDVATELPDAPVSSSE